MKTPVYYDISNKTLKIDVTDIFSYKNSLKFELKAKDKNHIFILKNYLVEEVCENEEYSIFLKFDFKNISLKKIKSIDLIQFKNRFFGNRRIFYYFKII